MSEPTPTAITIVDTPNTRVTMQKIIAFLGDLGFRVYIESDYIVGSDPAYPGPDGSSEMVLPVPRKEAEHE